MCQALVHGTYTLAEEIKTKQNKYVKYIGMPGEVLCWKVRQGMGIKVAREEGFSLELGWSGKGIFEMRKQAMSLSGVTVDHTEVTARPEGGVCLGAPGLTGAETARRGQWWMTPER